VGVVEAGDLELGDLELGDQAILIGLRARS
jgi:hypothetical protein